MTGEQLRPLEGRPYLKMWQERMVEPKPAKVAKVKRKKGKKAKR